MGDIRVIVSDDRYAGNYEIERGVLAAAGMELRLLPEESESCFLREAAEADGILVNLRKIDASVIGRLGKCRILSRYGVGYDNIDLDAAAAAGIWVSNVPDYSKEEVSDQATALLLACARLIVYKDKSIRAGKWDDFGGQRVNRIAGSVLGLIGYGRTARRLHEKLAGFNFAKVLVYDPYVDERTIADRGGEKCGLRDLLGSSDFVSVHPPLTSETRHLLGEKEFALMKPNAILVNTSRGPVVDQAALCAALLSHKIRAAGLDVYEQEPLAADSPLRTMDNVVLSDHCSYYSEESIVELKEKAARNVVAAIRGGRPTYPVNDVRVPRG